eukprot:symbB.v1.2.032993.t1/scaffold4038.1/size48387/2
MESMEVCPHIPAVFVVSAAILGSLARLSGETLGPWGLQARHDVPIKNCALMGRLQGRVLQDFRCKSLQCCKAAAGAC